MDLASRFVQGLQQIKGNSWAYLQPDGMWGLNNTALIVDGDSSLLIDTLIDIPRTRAMLNAMAKAHPAAGQIDTVFLTHWHVDHVLGIAADELRDSTIIASRICADYMANNPPKAWLACVDELQGDAKQQMEKTLADRFDFAGARYRQPTKIFERSIEFQVGGKKVVVVETKPSHTRSDSIVFVPSEGVAHTGDLVAVDRHVSLQYPFMTNLIESAKLLRSWDAEVYVTGHGPMASARDLDKFIEYLQFIQQAVRDYFDRGQNVDEAVDSLLNKLGPYRGLKNPAGLYFTVKLLFCEFAGDREEFARRNNPEFLATQWRIHQSLPKKHPELFAQFQ